MFIDFIDETESLAPEHLALVEKIILFASDYLKLPAETECSISFVDNDRIQVINRDYRGKDQPTDVISFALDDEPDDVFAQLEVSGGQPHHLGDIIISLERTQEQAEDYGHSFERELGFLALHGFLHLNGYDHMSEADEKEMFDLQKAILKDFGLERD